MHDLRELKEAGETGSDDEHRAEVELQKADRRRIAELDELLKPRKKRSSRSDVAGGPKGATSRRHVTLRSSPTATAAGPSSAGCRSLPAMRPAPTSSSSGCGMRSSLGIRGADRLLVLDRELESLRGEVAALMRCSGAGSRPRRRSWTPRACACASSAGAVAPVPRALIERMEWAESVTAANDRITLFVAFNYGGRAEIVDAATNLHRRRRGGVPRAPVRARTCTTPT